MSQPGNFDTQWTFPGVTAEEVAAYAARYYEPFWTTAFTFDGDQRTIVIEDGKTTIVETLVSQEDLSNAYSAVGVPGISGYQGSFTATGDGDGATLSWSTSWLAADQASSDHMSVINAGAEEAMDAALAKRFPQTS